MMTDATSKSPELTADETAAGELCNVQIPHDRLAWVGVLVAAVIGLAVFAVGGILTKRFLFAAAPIVWGLAVGLGWFGLAFRWKRSVLADVERDVSRHPEASPAVLVDYIFGTRGRPSMAYFLSYLAKTLAETGRTDITIRSNNREVATTLCPITVDFEAQPLCEKQTRLEHFDADASSEWAPCSTTRSQTSSTVPATQPRRHISKATYHKIATVLIPASFAFLLVDTYITGRDGWRIPFYAIVFTTTAMSVTLRSGWSFRRQWLVAPGGVILRESSFLRRGWQLHRFDRRQSVLIAHRVNRCYWVVFVANREMHRQATITESEAEFLLRAWLSPLHPPPLERLTDLA